MNPSIVTVATRFETSEKVWGMIAIETTARTAPADTACAVPISFGLASARMVPPRTVAKASARPIAVSNVIANRRGRPPCTMRCAEP